MPSVEQIQTHVPTSFKWTEEWGNHICIAGSFDPPIPTWSPIEMQKNKDNIHEVTLDLLPDKKFFYKFVVDGNWVLDRNIPSCPDSSGNWNHEIQVELPPPPPPTPPTPEETKEEMKEEMKEETKEEMKEEMKEEVNEEMKEEVKEEMKEEVNEEMKEEVKEEMKEEEMKEEVVVSEQLQQEVVIEEHKKEEVIAEETHEEMIVTEELQIEKHQEDQVMVEETHEEVIVTEELQIEKHQEDQVIVEDHKEEHHHDHQTVAEDHKIEQQHHEDQVVNEVKEEQNQYQEDHHVDENKQHQQEEQVVVEDKEQHQHQEDHHIVAEDHQMDENKQQHQEQEVMVENKEPQNQHQEDHQVVEELNQHHHEDDQKEQHHEDQIVTEINTTEQSCDDTVVTNESIINETMVSETITNETMVSETITNETMVSETITNETMVSETIINEEQPESSIIKETIIESDNDKLSAEHVAKESHDESMTNETLHTHPEPIDVSISHENVEEVTPQHKVTEISEVLNIEQSENLVNEFKVTEETSSTVGEKYETVVSSTTEIDEKPIESSEINEKVHEPEHETINENDDDENVEDYDHENEGAEDIGNIVSEIYDEALNPETLKEVLLNNTWAKDDSLEDAIPSSWTESHTSQSVIWPDDTNLEWSDINQDETTISKEIETTNKFETEVEDYSEHMSEETRVTEITSTNVEEEVISHEISSTVLVEETITGQTGSIVEEISAQSIVESHIEHKTEESDETGINKVSTSEVAELSFEKPESSATADKNMMSIPTTVVAAPAVEQQHSYLDEEIVTSQEIDKSKLDDVLKDNNISRKIISISPSSTSSPGESTRNADIYPHNITLATNTSRETVNIKSKHKKPVVEITSKIIIQHDGEEEEKIDLNDIAYLVTSVATTFTLGIISMLYKSVFGAGTKNQ